MRSPVRRRRTAIISGLAASAMALTLAACGGGSSSSSNKVVFWTSVDQVAVDAWKQTLIPEAKKEGVDLTIQKVDNINQVLLAKIAANSAPDISTVPQPGVLQAVVQRHAAFPLENVVDTNMLKSDLYPGLYDVGVDNGKLYGVMVGLGIKSIVIYPKGPWAKAGYQAPKSLADLQTLTNKIKAAGNGAPWCFGIGSGTATGWAATDWMEDLIMRQSGVTDYKNWVAGKLKFDSPQVQEAGKYMESILFQPGDIQGSIKQAASTTFSDAVQPMNANPNKPGCWMVHMGTFITGLMQKQVIANPDKYLGVFEFPPATAGEAPPLLIGGDTAMMLNDSPATKKVMKLIANVSLDSAEAKTGDQLSPFKTFDTSAYPSQLLKTVAGYAASASTLLFDGSDAMPAAVGTGSFWQQMTAWISGSEDLTTALQKIDATFPKSS